MNNGRIRLSLLVLCGIFLVLSACSDNKGKDTPPATKTASQNADGQAQQTAPPATAPNAAQVAPATDGGKCATLLSQKCTTCHTTARICEKLGKKSKARWQRSIDRMVERGAKLNAAEIAALLVCLESEINNLQSSCR